MTGKSRELLCKLASAYENGSGSEFDSVFYMGYPEAVLVELRNNGYIVVENDIVGTIRLTQAGYAAAKE